MNRESFLKKLSAIPFLAFLSPVIVNPTTARREDSNEYKLASALRIGFLVNRTGCDPRHQEQEFVFYEDNKMQCCPVMKYSQIRSYQAIMPEKYCQHIYQTDAGDSFPGLKEVGRGFLMSRINPEKNVDKFIDEKKKHEFVLNNLGKS